MRIDSIAASPDRSGRHLVKLDSGMTLRLYRQSIEDHGLYPGMELEEAQLETIRQRAGEYSAKMRAVRIVSAASVSKQELEQRLVRKGEAPEQARQAVEWMAELNLLDDRQTAEQIVRSCIYKGYGPARAKQALYEKRIPKQLWDEVLEDYPDQQDSIEQFLRTKLKDPNDPKQVKRAIDALMRRGHGYGQIRRVLADLGAQWEEYYG